MTERLRYALVTAARDEAANLPRLAESLAAQTVMPEAWIVVDNGSTDGTRKIAHSLAASGRWVHVLELPGELTPRRGAPIVRAFMAGVAALDPLPEVVVKLDADVSIEPDHFERLLEAFGSDPALGIASGTCWELQDGSWRPQHVSRDHARGAVRAYRRECLAACPPARRTRRLGRHRRAQGADARLAGPKLPRPPHPSPSFARPAGAPCVDVGRTRRHGPLHGYRPSYLVARAAYRASRDPLAIVMVYGYVRAVLRRSPRYDDVVVRRLLRDEHALRRPRYRIREALGRI